MTHWREKRDDISDRKELYDALAQMVFILVMSLPVFAVWLAYIIWKTW